MSGYYYKNPMDLAFDGSVPIKKKSESKIAKSERRGSVHGVTNAPGLARLAAATVAIAEAAEGEMKATRAYVLC